MLTCVMIDTFSSFAVYNMKRNILFAFRRYGVVDDKDRNASLTTSLVEDDLAIVAPKVTDLHLRACMCCSNSCESIKDGSCTDDFGCLAMHRWRRLCQGVFIDW